MRNFPGARSTISGVGHWVKPAPIMNFGQVLSPGDRGEAVAALQKSLGEYGYGVDVNGEYDAVTREVVTAFQRHFRPERIDGDRRRLDPQHACGTPSQSRPRADHRRARPQPDAPDHSLSPADPAP